RPPDNSSFTDEAPLCRRCREGSRISVDDFDLFKSDDDGLGAAVLTQQSLIDTQERLGAMLDVMPIGLLIHTEQGILFANRAACDLLRMTKERLVGQHLLDYMREADVPKLADQFRNSFAGET